MTAPLSPPSRSGWAVSAALALACGIAYLANGRELGSYDTIPATLLPHAILRGEGPVLDRFASLIENPDGSCPDYAERRSGHLVSRYPLAPAVLALPLAAFQRLLWSLARPDWDRNPATEWVAAHAMAKNAAVVMAALTVLLLHRLLRPIARPFDAALATLAAGVGSPMWTTASQALWQHGPSALALTAALLALRTVPSSRLSPIAAGGCVGLLLAIRPADLALAAPLGAWMAFRRSRQLPLFLLGTAVVLAPALLYNVATFGTAGGGLSALESLHPERHAVPGSWSPNPLAGLAGTILSPSRGLFVFVPWTALAVVLSPWSLRELRRHPPLLWGVLGLIPFTAMLSAYAVWWGGFCYGPRYWTEAVPLLAILLAAALDWTRARAPSIRVLILLTIAWSIALQALGAWLYPSSWNLKPANVDTHHERLWDWSDTEVTRMIHEKLIR